MGSRFAATGSRRLATTSSLPEEESMQHLRLFLLAPLLAACGQTEDAPPPAPDASAESSTDAASDTVQPIDGSSDALDASDAPAFKGWSSAYGTLGSPQPLVAAMDPAGGVLVAVDLQPNESVDFGGGGTGGRAVVGKLGPTGTFAFQKGYATDPSSSAYVFSVATDALGASYVVGQFQGTIDFGGGPVAAGPAITPFVVKYDPTGKHVFTKTFTSNQQVGAQAIAIDPAGGFYVGYVGGGLIDFGGGVRTVNSGSIAIVRYDASGTWLWDKVLPGGGNAGVTGLTLDNAGNPIFAGHVGGAVDFGAGPLPFVGGSTDVVVAKLGKAAGALTWAKTFGTVGDELPTGIVHDPTDDGFVLVGTYPNTIDFGKGPLPSAGMRDVFVARFDSASPPTTKWSTRYGAADTDIARGVALDSKGALHVTGDIGSAVDFGGGLIGGTGSMFHLQLTSQGAYVAAKIFGGSGQGSAVATGPGDRLLLAGTFAGSSNFGFGPINAPSQRTAVYVAVTP